jgi:hypothetical protein
MKRPQPGLGLLASYGQLLARVGHRFASFFRNEQRDETWAKFALAEAMEELRAAESRTQIRHTEERI